MAETLAGFQLVVGDLADELGAHGDPFRVLPTRPTTETTGHAPGICFPFGFWNLRLQRLQPGDQLLAFGGAERRGVPDVMHRALLVIEAEQQRSE